VLGGGYWRFVYGSLNEDLQAAQAEHDTKVQTNRRLADDIPRYQELRTQMTTLRELIEKNEAALPSEAELPAFIETLQRKVTEAGVATRRWTYKNPELVETFVKVPFEVEVTGTFMQIKRFFASLVQKDVRLSANPEERASEVHDRIVSIENLALTTPTVQSGEIVLTARFTAVTFRQEDRPAAKPGAPAAPAGRPAPPPPRAPPASAPPLPTPATPAGAKAQVEDAVNRGDARNRNAATVDDTARAGNERLKGGL
jgi:Tfp pilus assembly protein PilO